VGTHHTMVPAPHRELLLSVYVLFTLSGIASLLRPLQPVEHATLTWQTITLTAFFICGGAWCVVGALSDLWICELIGLPQLMATFAVFSVIALKQFSLSALSGGLFFIGLTLLFGVRWVQLWGIRRMAEKCKTE